MVHIFPIKVDDVCLVALRRQNLMKSYQADSHARTGKCFDVSGTSSVSMVHILPVKLDVCLEALPVTKFSFTSYTILQKHNPHK
jgi:hypothetical protein